MELHIEKYDDIWRVQVGRGCCYDEWLIYALISAWRRNRSQLPQEGSR